MINITETDRGTIFFILNPHFMMIRDHFNPVHQGLHSVEFALRCKALVTDTDNKSGIPMGSGNIYSMNGTFFLEDLLLSLK